MQRSSWCLVSCPVWVTVFSDTTQETWAPWNVKAHGAPSGSATPRSSIIHSTKEHQDSTSYPAPWHGSREANWPKVKGLQHISVPDPFCFSLSLGLFAIPLVPYHIPGLHHQPISPLAGQCRDSGGHLFFFMPLTGCNHFPAAPLTSPDRP